LPYRYGLRAPNGLPIVVPIDRVRRNAKLSAELRALGLGKLESADCTKLLATAAAGDQTPPPRAQRACQRKSEIWLGSRQARRT